jgi:GWxTD domain-containing protein
MRSLFLLLFACICISACTSTNRLSKQNLEYRYNTNVPVNLQTRTLDEGANLRIFLALEMNKLSPEATFATLNEKYAFSYYITHGYKSSDKVKPTTPLEFEKDYGRDERGLFHVSFPVEKLQMPSALMVLNVVEKSTNNVMTFDIPLDFSPNLHTQYGVYKMGKQFPLYSNYITTQDTITIRNAAGKRPRLYVTQFQDSFNPALPPMALSASGTRKGARPTNRYEVNAGGYLQFYEEGLYFVQEDTASKEGFSFVVSPNKFPRVTRAEELISPLIYITTRDERNRLTNTDKPKEALDKFWLDISGNKEFAKRIIRSYYTKVETANYLFTNHKPGWQTDQGMIYIIFGAPDKLLRHDDREEWYYEKNANSPEIYFTFVKRPSQIAGDYLELVRYNEYDRVWYATVEQWRKGIIRK